VTPLGHGRCRAVTRLKDQGLDSALEQVGDGGQALRTGPDDADGIHFDLHALTFFDESRVPITSTDVNACGKMKA